MLQSAAKVLAALPGAVQRESARMNPQSRVDPLWAPATLQQKPGEEVQAALRGAVLLEAPGHYCARREQHTVALAILHFAPKKVLHAALQAMHRESAHMDTQAVTTAMLLQA